MTKPYKPLPVIVKYVKPGWFPDTMYRSFRTVGAAKEWLRTMRYYIPSPNGTMELPITKYRIYTEWSD